MDSLDFEKAKEELKTLARNSALFIAQPENLEEFEKETDKLKPTTGTERIVSYLIGLFKEEKQQTSITVSILRQALVESAR